ncbi:hypothetical protein HCMG_00321 [Helicobacter canadensis MIT 98-5491]|nr:hypothetical protein HCMG_00321 [Helicobacter canadensis MIT 98-5491]
MKFVGYSDIVFIDDSMVYSSLETMRETIGSKDSVFSGFKKKLSTNLNIY